MKRLMCQTVSRAHHMQLVFSEQDILSLQEDFLTAGIHRIEVKDHAIGRAFIIAFIKALRCYSHIACLTLTSDGLGTFATDIYTEFLDEFGLFDKNYLEHNYLESLFIDLFAYDFMWIEETHLLLVQPWYRLFKRKLVEYSIAQSVPIVILAYRD